MSESGKAVFLSYASQDAEAAKRICEALRAAGVEVWFDQSELVGGDAWDQKIRKQIKDCALLIPIISVATQARTEGYFRLEWRLADQRTHLMAKGRPFLLPVVIDDTRDSDAHVPDSFTEVQWTRLPGGETPPAFAQRVLKLLRVDVGRDRLIPPSPREPKDDRGGISDPALQKPSRSWLIPTIIGVAALAGLALWQPWKKSTPPAPVPVTTTATTPPALSPPAVSQPNPSNGLTEAQKLVAQARAVYDNGDELNRENISFADDLVKQALVLDRADPAAWELAAWLSYTMVWQAFDNSDARRETMTRQSARALALAPASVSAQLVVLNARTTLNYVNAALGPSQDLSESERELLALAAREPGNWQVPRLLGQIYRFQGRPDDSIATLRRAVDLSQGKAAAVVDLANVLYRLKRYDEASALMAPALKREPTGRLLTFDQMIKCRWHGDITGAQAALQTWPGWLMSEDRGAFLVWQTWMWSRQPDKALAAALRVQRDYLRDVHFTGPRAVLTARAHELAGRAEAARAEWRTVVQHTDRELAVNPDDLAALHWKTWALTRLGDTATAQVNGTLLRQRTESSQPSFFKATNIAALWVTLGQPELAFQAMHRQLQEYDDSYGVTRAMLELDPAYDPVRADPRFKEIVALAPAPKAQTQDPGPSSPSVVDAKSVAVLAFANLSSDKEQEYFSDGISEELLNVLAKVPGLKVSARTSAFYFKGKEVPIPEIARQLGVAYVVEGSVRKQGDKVRITAQLIKAADGFHVWSDTFTRDLKDIFAVQDEIAALIAQKLSIKLGTSAAVSSTAVNPEAYRLMLEGRHFLTPRTTAGFEQAYRAFSAALKLDPQFAPAQAGLASTTALRGRYRLLEGLGRVEEFDQLALAQSRLALQMDPTLAEPHATIGFIHTDTGNLAEAEQEFLLAIAANPNFATAYHWHSHVLAATGRLDLALKEIERAEALDPVSFIILFIRGFYLLDSGQYAEALVTLDRAAAIRGETFLPLESDRARGLLALGRKPEALAAARRVLQDPRLITSGWYAAGEALYVLHVGGAADEAARIAPAILQALPKDGYQRGYVHCALGNFAEGLGELAHIPSIVQSRLFWHPMLESVHDTPQFRQLLEKLNAGAEFKVARATLAKMKSAQGRPK